jgi:hypothetical protein
MGSALPALIQSRNVSLEIWSSGGCRLKNSATINAAFELMPTGKGETEESILACASGRRPSARQRFRQGHATSRTYREHNQRLLRLASVGWRQGAPAREVRG